MKKIISQKKTQIREAKLANGLTLVHLHTKRDPVSAGHLFLPGGASQESEAQSGLATLRWSLLLKGSARRSARQLAEDIESLGASVSGGATHDYSEISCHATSPFFLQTMKIMAEALFWPAFHGEEISKEKEALIAAIQSKKESIFSTASEEFNKHLYHSHPYSRPASGTEASVARLRADDLFRWNAENVVPRRAILAIASDLSFDRLKKEMDKIFGPSAWSKGKTTVPKKIPAVPPVRKAVAIRLREKFEQAYLMIGFPTGGINSKNYLATKVLNACLGGGMSTRLFQELREKRGLAYDVGSYYPSKISGSAFVIYLGLQASRLEQAKSRIHKILAEVRRDGIPAPELVMMKNYLKGTYLLDHQTNSQRAHYLGWWRVLDKPASFDRTYIDKINQVTPLEILKASRTIFSQKPITVEIRPTKVAA